MYSVGVYEYLTLHVTTIYLTPYYDPTPLLVSAQYCREDEQHMLTQS
jgi:hypothetical protein